LSAGEYELRATGERLSGEAERLVLGVAEEAGPFELAVKPAVRVTLRVERRGRACTGGWVQLTGQRLQDAREIAEGRVLFEAVPSGDYQLSVACGEAAFQDHPLVVREDDIEDTLRLEPGQLLAGRVLDAAGTGATGVLVSVSPMGLPEGRAYMTCRSGAGGDFACDGLSPGAYRCHAGLEQQPQSEFVDVSVAAGMDPGPIELVLPPRATLLVSLEHAPPEQLSSTRVLARAGQGPTLEGERRGSEFHFEGLLLGSYEVYLAASPATRREVSLARDGQSEPLTLPWPSTRTISGVVLDERNQPVVDVWVHAAAEGSLLPAIVPADVGVPALTDAAGRFSVEGVFEGRYHLRVRGTELEGLARSVPGGAEDVVIHSSRTPHHDLQRAPL
ncbi:MAG TPA: carboxypeptidase-like regulatory domain-containing protein, partial [Polyangiaceae bacterium]|nr:carboxypeptidase-like regulatory domain-containing protein [Polyangiaceae bacterium]